jgi:hypothetical protein
MAEKTKESKLVFFDGIKPVEVRWLAKPFLPLGKISVVQGDPGAGKSCLLLSIAAHVSTGAALPFSASEPITGNVIYQNAEDGAADTLKPRLVSMGADCKKIAFIDAASLNIDDDCKLLERYVRETKARLLVLDPFTAFIGTKADMCRASDIRRLMVGLSKIAEGNDCAVVIVAHMNKSAGAKDLYRALGSIDIPAAARSVLLVGRDEDGDTRYVKQIKSSLSTEGAPFAFRIGDDSAVEYLGEYESESPDEIEVAPGDGGKRHKAAEIILAMLNEGARPATEILDACAEAGISAVTAKRVKGYLGVKSVREPDEWYWTL